MARGSALSSLLRFVISFTLTILLSQYVTFAQSTTAATQNSPEYDQQLAQLKTWILKQVAAGEAADINKFPGGKDIVIPSSFIEELLRGSNKVDVEYARIEGITLTSADFPFDVNLSQCHFLKKVDFSQSTFHKSVKLEGAIFDDVLNLHLSTIGGDLNAKSSHFTSPTAPINLSGIKVAGRILFTGTVFAGSVWLQSAQVSLDVDLFGASFTNSEATANFQNINITGDISLRGSESHPTVLDGEVRFDGAKISGFFETNSWTLFNNTKAPPRFSDMKVGTAQFSIHSFKGQPVFSGMTYDNLLIFEKDDDGENVLTLLDKAQYSTDVYARAEDFLKKSGQADKADNVFIRRKIRERDGLPWYSRLWSRFLRIFVGYGRQPWLAFIWWFVIIAIGGVTFFKKRWMVLSDKKEAGQEANHYFNPFWYSLDLFAPVIDLGIAKMWEPGPNHKYVGFARQYVYIHKILGWVLIPIGVAAMTGYIK